MICQSVRSQALICCQRSCPTPDSAVKSPFCTTTTCPRPFVQPASADTGLHVPLSTRNGKRAWRVHARTWSGHHLPRVQRNVDLFVKFEECQEVPLPWLGLYVSESVRVPVYETRNSERLHLETFRSIEVFVPHSSCDNNGSRWLEHLFRVL